MTMHALRHEPRKSRVRGACLALFGASLLAACGGSPTTGTTTPNDPSAAPAEPTDPSLAGVLAAHNQVRAQVSPAPSSPLPKLQWSEADAKVAAEYAEQCTFSHNRSRGPRGENLFAGSGETKIEDVVKSWASESESYDYASNGCRGTCGHYTQIVWAGTTHVGCASKTCTTGSPFGKGTWQIWVCNYSPPGNMNGQKPY